MVIVMVIVVSIVNVSIVIIFMTAVCSNCRGAHYKSRKARCTMSGEQVSYYTLDILSLVIRGFFDAPHRYPEI